MSSVVTLPVSMLTTEQLLAIAERKIVALDRQAAHLHHKIERLEEDLDDHQSAATVLHRLREAWDGGGQEVVIDAGSPDRVEAIRGALRLVRQYCAEHPEVE